MRAPPSTAVRARLRGWLRWWQAGLLGVLTVGSYGLVAYSYGVFISPIHSDTGWSVGALSAAFTLAMLLGGLGAAATGWFLDRAGGRPVMAVSLAAGSTFLLLASFSRDLPLFIIAWALGGGIIAAGLFYNVTMALTTRLYPTDRVRAFAVLTFVGGFAAVLYFPLAGLLVELLEWRLALRVLTALLALHTVPAILFVSGGAALPIPGPETGRSRDYRGVVEALRSPEVLTMIAMFSLAQMSFGAIQVFHVPAIEATGVSLGAATAVASIRGLLSLPGRALLGPVVDRIGINGALGLVYLAMALGTIPIAIGGEIGLLAIFALVTGLAFGTIMPLHGLFAAEVFGEARIGTLMGVQSLIVSLSAAAGPLLLGLTVDVTGGYIVAILGACTLFGLAALLLAIMPRRRPEQTAVEPHRPANPEIEGPSA